VRVDGGIITALDSELEAILAYIPSYGTVSCRRQYNVCLGARARYDILHVVMRSSDCMTRLVVMGALR